MKQLYSLLLLLFIPVFAYCQDARISNVTIEEGGINVRVFYENHQGISILKTSHEIDQNNISIDICFQQGDTQAFVHETVDIFVPFQGDLDSFVVNLKAFSVDHEITDCNDAILADEDTYYASLEALFEKSWYLKTINGSITSTNDTFEFNLVNDRQIRFSVNTEDGCVVTFRKFVTFLSNNLFRVDTDLMYPLEDIGETLPIDCENDDYNKLLNAFEDDKIFEMHIIEELNGSQSLILLDDLSQPITFSDNQAIDHNIDRDISEFIWYLESINDADIDSAPSTTFYVDINQETFSYAGSGICSCSYIGGILTDSTFSGVIGNCLFGTCTDPNQDLLNTFLFPTDIDNQTTAFSYEIETPLSIHPESKLIITNSNGEIARFTNKYPAVSQQHIELENNNWYLRSLSELEDLDNLMDYSDALQVEFSADNYISVDLSCSSGFGRYINTDYNSFYIYEFTLTLSTQCPFYGPEHPISRIGVSLDDFWDYGTYTFDIENDAEGKTLTITKDDGSTATYVRPKNNIDQLVQNKWYPIQIEEELPPENYNGYIDFSINDGSFQLNTFLGQECGECRTELQNMTTSTFEHFQSNTSCEDLGTSCHAYDSILFYLFDTSLLSNDNLINYEYSIINDQEFSTLNITNKLEEIVGVFTNNPNRLSISSFNITKTPYIYPTVINGNSNIQFNDAVTSSSIIEVYDIVGRLINTSSKENFSPNVKALNSGVYFISIIQNGAFLKTEKIIIQ